MLNIPRVSALSSVRHNTSADALGTATLNAVESLPDYKQGPQAYKDLMRPYFANITENLSLPADTKVCVASVMQVTQAYVAWVRTHEVFEYTRVHFQTSHPAYRQLSQVIELFEKLEAELSGVLRDIPGTLKRIGKTEREVLATRLSPVMMARYDRGNLTIADLCKLDPRSLFLFGGQQMQSGRLF